MALYGNEGFYATRGAVVGGHALVEGEGASARLVVLVEDGDGGVVAGGFDGEGCETTGALEGRCCKAGQRPPR